MSLMQIVLALICFGLGYLIAGSSGSTISPLYLLGLIVATLGISMIIRHFGNKKDK